MDIVVCVLMIVFGVVFLYIYTIIRKHGYNAKSWGITTGKITQKHVGERKRLPGTDQNNFRIYVNYSYSVNDIAYEGTNYHVAEIRGGEVSMLQRMAEKELNSIADQPKVYYNKINPAISFLKPVSKIVSVMILFFGILCLLIGLLLCIPL